MQLLPSDSKLLCAQDERLCTKSQGQHLKLLLRPHAEALVGRQTQVCVLQWGLNQHCSATLVQQHCVGQGLVRLQQAAARCGDDQGHIALCRTCTASTGRMHAETGNAPHQQVGMGTSGMMCDMGTAAGLIVSIACSLELTAPL